MRNRWLAVMTVVALRATAAQATLDPVYLGVYHQAAEGTACTDEDSDHFAMWEAGFFAIAQVGVVFAATQAGLVPNP